jgi:uncharacterized integral membrane protein
MRTLANLLTSLVVAIWVVAIAILSVQNATPVSLKFLNFQSIQLPLGLVLAFSAALGIIFIALTQPLWSLADSRAKSENGLDDEEFYFDE